MMKTEINKIVKIDERIEDLQDFHLINEKNSSDDDWSSGESDEYIDKIDLKKEKNNKTQENVFNDFIPQRKYAHRFSNYENLSRITEEEDENERFKKSFYELKKASKKKQKQWKKTETELSGQLEQKENIIQDLLKDLKKLSLSKQQHVFCNPNVNSENILSGSPNVCIDKILTRVQERNNINFYIGGTSDPNTRCADHLRKKKFKELEILYFTTSLTDAMIVEDEIIEKVFNDYGCKNKRSRTFGLVPNKNAYYVYILQ